MRRALTPSSAFLVALAILLTLFHAVLAVTASAGKSMTADEIAHLTAGHAYNTRHDFRLQPENGNLPQRWAALPLLIAGAALPPTKQETWKIADVWNYGHEFFYERGLSTDEFLFLGRGMIAFFSAATGLLVFFWSRALFGWRGAFLSLALFAFCPAFLAHGALATSDAVMTFFFLASVGAWCQHLEKPGVVGACISAVTLGIAFVAKFSAVLLPPMLGLIAIIWFSEKTRTGGWRTPLARLGRIMLLHAIVAWAVIWVFYEFRFSAFAPETAAGATLNHGWGWLLQDLGWPAKIIWALKEYHVLPEAWLYGFTYVVQFSHARGAFLNGDYSLTGWVSFFPFAFLVKTPIPLLLLCGAVLIAGVRGGAQRLRAAGTDGVLTWLRPLTPLAVLFLIFWATSLASHLNIGHRHILPTYPVLFICAGWLGRQLDFRRPLLASAVLGISLWHASESLWIRPHYLAYFNQFVGGSVNGWRHLVDSSLDWGQDLPELASWLQRNDPQKKEPVFLAYFGTGEPEYEGITATRVLSLPNFGRIHPRRPLGPGIYCVSATLLQQVYAREHQWSVPLEREYQELRSLEAIFFAYSQRLKQGLERTQYFPSDTLSTRWKRYEQLRFARLSYYLKVRPADANAGYSILIYRLSSAEISAATAGPLADWIRLIERTTAQRSS